MTGAPKRFGLGRTACRQGQRRRRAAGRPARTTQGVARHPALGHGAVGGGGVGGSRACSHGRPIRLARSCRCQEPLNLRHVASMVRQTHALCAIRSVQPAGVRAWAGPGVMSTSDRPAAYSHALPFCTSAPSKDSITQARHTSSVVQRGRAAAHAPWKMVLTAL